MMPTPMQPSNDGLHLTEQFEGGPPNADGTYTAYWDAIGQVWTIGPGLTGAMADGTPIAEGLNLTQDQVDAEVRTRYAAIQDFINQHVNVQLTQHEDDALCDFCWNVGLGAFGGSTLLKDLNNGDFAGAADQFERWDQSHGVVIAGLLRRRLAEKAEFNTPDAAEPVS